MPFYLRKSVSAGPFRFNFSKGGVGVSVGVRGFRVGTGPRGHYVHAGRGGFYYRASLGRAGQPRSTTLPSPSIQEDSGVVMIEIDSGDVLEMRDENFIDLLNEINAKQAQIPKATLFPLLAALSILFILAIYPKYILISAALIAVAYGAGRWLDAYQRRTVLFYDLEDEVRQTYEEFTQAFDELVGCQRKWHIEAGGAVTDLTTWKRNAGASHIVKRKQTTVNYELPIILACNLTPPAVKVGRQVIHFLPDVALVIDGGKVGAVGYRDLKLRWQSSNFIEEEGVPGDTVVLGYTWKHPNKSGGPDRRFKHNHQSPICRYEVLHLTSNSGVNELLEVSKPGTMQSFVRAASALGRVAKAAKPAALETA